MSDDDLATLRELSRHSDRLDQAAENDRRAALRETITEQLLAIDAGERQKTVSVWDGELAALSTALDEHPAHAQAIGNALREEFDDAAKGEPDRSEVLRRALRLGLREAAPDYVDALRAAVRDHATRDL
jgi:septal ring factor EnvC (AmiA/AmiB activator)